MIAKKILYKFSETLLQFYNEESILEKLLEQTLAIDKYLRKNKDIINFLINQDIPFDYKHKVLSEMLAQLEADEFFLNTFVALLKNNLLPDWKPFLKILIKDLYKKLNIKLIFVSSTTELSDIQKRKLVDAFAKRLKAKILPNYKIDLSLILGIRVKYDDIIEEFSLNSKLKQITKELRKHIVNCPVFVK